MSLRDNIQKDLEVIEDSLMDSTCSFIELAGLTWEQTESLYLLLDNFYRHGLETLDSGIYTGYHRFRTIDRLRDEIGKYRPSHLTEQSNEYQ